MKTKTCLQTNRRGHKQNKNDNNGQTNRCVQEINQLLRSHLPLWKLYEDYQPEKNNINLPKNLVLNIQQFSGLSDAKKFQGAAQVCFKLGSPTIMATHWDKNRHKAHILGMLSLWRNRLARSAVNRKVGGSSPPRDGYSFWGRSFLQ